MSETVLIDASNLHSGGGVQVAASFLDELSELLCSAESTQFGAWLRPDNVRIEMSTAVARNMQQGNVHRLPATIIDRSPRAMRTWVPKSLTHDVRFTVFGPAYGPKGARSHIVGFADGTSLFPEEVPLAHEGWTMRARAYARRRASRFFYRRVDRIVVEAPNLVGELEKSWQISSSMISVVPNTINRLLISGDEPSTTHIPDGPPSFCYVSRAYPHKNFRVLAQVNELLWKEHGLGPVRFVFTLTGPEWESLPESLRRSALNLGPVEVSRLPGIYAGCVGSVFPSKLESFSVTPLEALTMGTPLIASNRPFVRDIVGSAAIYADPDEPRAWADAIAEVLTNGEAVNRRVETGLRLAHNWPDARDRAAKYLAIIEGELKSGRSSTP